MGLRGKVYSVRLTPVGGIPRKKVTDSDRRNNPNEKEIISLYVK